MSERRGTHLWISLVGCFAVGAGFNAYLIAPVSVSPLLVAEFDIGTPAVGFAISAVFLGWAIAGIPGGYLTDRHDNRRLVLAGAGVFVAAAWIGVMSPTYLGFLALRFVAGLMGAFLWTANTNVITRIFPGHSRSLATGLFVASAPAGQALAQFASPLLAPASGWRTIFVHSVQPGRV